MAIYGNFVNRALVLTNKYFDGKVPACGELTDYDKATIEEFKNVKATLEELLNAFRFRDAQKEAMNLARIGNKYLADTEPWKLAKTDMNRTATVLHLALQLDKLARIKAENEKAAQEEALRNWRPEPVKEPNSFDEFEKNDIRVGTVLECTNVKKSDRLLQFHIEDGMGGRTILSGIAQSYPDPSVLVGKQVLFIANFPPRKMMGIESQGMILSAVDADGKLVVTTVSAPVKNGCQVG